MASVPPLPSQELARLLERTSRTFALAIPLLEEPLATQVGLAYLLLRIADELEDAPRWERDRRARALASFVQWLDATQRNDGAMDASGELAAPKGSPGGRQGSGAPSAVHAGDEWRALVASAPPTDDAGCLDLLTRADDVLGATRSLPPPVANAIVAHTKRTALGMRAFVERQDERGALVLADVAELRRYAYVVAGIVGELLTELFALSHAGVAEARAALDEDAAAFGEGLQLVNILKDASADARQGRRYLPPGVARSAVVDLARRDLTRAHRYVHVLAGAGAPRGIITFCELPVRLADATLDRLAEGAAKLSRTDVMRIVESVTSRPEAECATGARHP